MKLFSEITQRFPVYSSEMKPDNNEIGLEANESKQNKLQMLINLRSLNEFREFYLPQNRLIQKLKHKAT